MKTRTLLLIAALLLTAIGASAQNTDIEALSGIQFNFANPGARSLGMGGAFLGLADDASAAEANPAGLTILRRPEVSIEGRNWRVGQEVNVSGTYPDLVSQEFSSYSRRAEITFGSVSMPFKKDFAFAIYYHQPLQYENAAAVLPGRDASGNIKTLPPNFYLPRGGTPVSQQECRDIQNQHPGDVGACVQYVVFPFVTAVDVSLTTYGGAFAWKHGPVSVGLGARYQKFSEGAFTFRQDFSGNPASVAVQTTAKLKNGTLEMKDETDITWNLGVKYAPREDLSFGAVYKKGAEFDAPTYGQNAGGTFQKIADTTVHIPDIMGLGVSWRPLPVLTVNVDADRIQYSNLADNVISVNADIRALDKPYEANDVTEFHVGAEYFLTTKIPVALRAGWWRDPAHAMTWQGPLNSPTFVAADILFPGTKDQDHLSFGVGLAWPSFQIDAAYDTSDLNKVGSLSAVYRF